MLINDFYQDLKDLIALRRQENKAKELTLKLLKEFQSLDGLKKWFDQVSYGVRPNGVFYETKIDKIFITIDPKKKTVGISGQMDDGTYLDQSFRVKKEDIQEIAKEMAERNLEGLKTEKAYLEEELKKVSDVIESTEERIAKNEFDSKIETKVEKKLKKESKKKMKTLISKTKKK